MRTGSDRSPVRRAGIALAALAFVFGSVGLPFVAGTGDYWSVPQGDVADALIGWFYYARDAWHFPLFHVGNYHAPEGSYVTLSDSLPLLSLVGKILRRGLGDAAAQP